MEKIAVMGAGAVGGYYGALLARSGLKIAFVARGAHLAAIRERGLRIESEGDPPLVVRDGVATDDPAAIGPVDLVLFTPKVFDLEGAVRSIAPLVGAGTLVVPLLNGLDIADRLAAVVGRQHVLAGVCHISSVIAEPGLIRRKGPFNRVVVGEIDGGASARASAVVETMRRAGINAHLSEDMTSELWKKFYFLDPWAALCATTRSPLGAVRGDPDTRAVLIQCIEEVHALARAREVALPRPAEALATLDGLPADMTPSLLRALEQGAPLELDVFPGTAVRLGNELGVPTPAHRFLLAALKLLAGGRGRT